MKFYLIMITLVISPHSYSKALNKAIYGEDSRVLVSDLDSQKLLNLASGVGALFQKYTITDENESAYLIRNKTLQEVHRVCPDEKFAQKPSLSSCTGFLVADDLMITAGHCIKDKEDCKNVLFSFDYQKAKTPGEYLELSKNQSYFCKEVLQSSYGAFSRTDFALVRLDRKVVGRKPLKIRRDSIVLHNQSLFVLGHPMGLPLIYADNGKVLKNYGLHSFVTNLDTFSGNSGSPVFNAETLIVEGLLVRGEEDLDYDVEYGCYKNKICSDNSCRGESVVRTTALPLSKIPLLK